MVTKRKKLSSNNTRKRGNFSYIFAYGSLVNDKDRETTTKRKDKTFPVIIKEGFGYQRSYDFSSSYLRHRRVLGIKKIIKKIQKLMEYYLKFQILLLII